MDEPADAFHFIVSETEDVEPELAEALADRFLVEDTDDCVFAVDAGHDRDAKIDAAAFDLETKATVLRDSLLRNIELRHDFDAADDLRVVRFRDGLHRPRQSTVDPVLDDDFLVPGLDVDIRGTSVERVVDRGVDEADDRRRRVGEPVDGKSLFAVIILPDDLHVEALGSFFEHPLCALTFLQELLDGGIRSHGRPHRHLQNSGKLVHDRHVGRIRGDDDELPVIFLVREEVVAEHQVHGNTAEQILVGLKAGEVDELEPASLGEAFGVVELLGLGLFRSEGCAFWVELGDEVVGVEVTCHNVSTFPIARR